MVALAGGMLIALLAAPKGKRWIILAAVIVLAIGGYSLTDPGFWERAKTIAPTEGQWESSAQGRVDIWRAALDMFCDHPLGVGARGFLEVIGLYDPARVGRDAHNTLVLCACELGFQGVATFLLLIVGAMATLRNIYRKSQSLPKAQADDFVLLHWALAISLGIFVLGGLTVTLLYVEALYWFMALPVCLERALENTCEDLRLAPGGTLQAVSAQATLYRGKPLAREKFA
jgi:O-antigen ligase